MKGACITALASLAACDSFADKAYVGEAEFTMVGQFLASGPPSTHATGIALLWQDAATAGGPGLVRTSVPVQIAFPETFSVPILTAPPSEVMFTFSDGGPSLAEAYVYVVSDHSDSRSLLGLDTGHALIYAAGDVLEGSAAASYLGGAVSAGYHLRRYALMRPPPASQQELVATCEASGSSVAACVGRRSYQLRDAPDDEPLRIALWPP